MSEEQQKNGAPVSRETERSASRRVSRETSEEPQKNKRSSAYIYLLILFGAAFLMLLLAYFVQQRNNQTTQDSWGLSREELMAENRKLTEKNEELEQDFLPDGDDRSQYDFGVADGPTPAERYQEIVEKLS